MLRFVVRRSAPFIQLPRRLVFPASSIQSGLPGHMPENFEESTLHSKTTSSSSDRKAAYMLLGTGIGLAGAAYGKREKQEKSAVVTNKAEFYTPYFNNLAKKKIPYYLGVQQAFCEEKEEIDISYLIETIKDLANKGDPEAQFALGEMYREGRGIAKDEVQAFKWYSKAAEQGNDVAQFGLGWMYQEGRGIAKDEVQAFKWYSKAAEQGNDVAQFALGWMYQKGLGTAKDEVQAFKWYSKAAEHGNSDAQCVLGLMYQEGRGEVVKDEVQAVAWYRKAAEQGNDVAQFALGEMYQKGRGVTKKDKQKAIEWYQKAAKQLNAEAQFALGMYDEAKKQLNVFSSFHKGIILYKTGEISESVKFFKEVSKTYAGKIDISSLLRKDFYNDSNYEEKIENRKKIYKLLDELIKREKDSDVIRFYKFEKVYFLLIDGKDNEASDVLYEDFHGSGGDGYVKANISLMNDEVKRRLESFKDQYKVSIENWLNHHHYAYLSLKVYNEPGAQNLKKSWLFPKKRSDYIVERVSPSLSEWKKYKDSSELLPEKYRHGYYGAVYINDAAKEIVISHRGTGFSLEKFFEIIGAIFGISSEEIKNTYGDFIADAFFALFGYPNEHFAAAYEFTELVWKEIEADTNTDYPDRKNYGRSHTGHSLGALSAAVTAYRESKEKNIVRVAVTFDSPGPGYLLRYMYGEPSDSYIYTTNYVAEPNYVNTASSQIGTILRIYPYKYLQQLEPVSSISPVPFHDVIGAGALFGYYLRERLRTSPLSFMKYIIIKNSAFKILMLPSLIPSLSVSAATWGIASWKGVEEKKNSLSILGGIIYLLIAETLKGIKRLYSPESLCFSSSIEIINFRKWIICHRFQLAKGFPILFLASLFSARVSSIGSEVLVETIHLFKSHNNERSFSVFAKENDSDIPRAQKNVQKWPGGHPGLFKNFISCYKANKAAQKTETYDLDDFPKLDGEKKDDSKKSDGDKKNARQYTLIYHKSLLEHQIGYKVSESNRVVMPLSEFSEKAQQFLLDYEKDAEATLKKYNVDHNPLLELYKIERSKDVAKMEVHLIQIIEKFRFEEIKNNPLVTVSEPFSQGDARSEFVKVSYPFTIHEFRDWVNRQCARFAPSPSSSPATLPKI